MVTITNEDFIEYTGIDLSLELKDLDDGYEKVDRTIKLWTTRVYREMGLSTTRARYQFSEYQINAIKECIIEYGMYYLKNGDLYRLSGYDEDKGKTIDFADIAKIQFPQHCMRILQQAGLISRSFGRRKIVSQKYDEYY
jgi:hypothetical protein